jgi:putative ABC transport system permease protein
MGLAIGLWVAFVFSLRPLLALRRVSPLQALRRDADAVVVRRMRRDSSAAVVAFATVASVFALTIARSSQPLEGIGFGIAILGAVGALQLIASLLIMLARRVVRPSWPFLSRQAVASLHRPGNQTRAVIVSLGFGVFLMSTLYQVHTNLLHQIDSRLEQLRANIVFFDVQREQAPGVDSIIRGSGGQVLQRIPIVNVRLAAINGRSLDSLLADARRQRQGRRGPGRGGRRFAPRDWRATYGDSLPTGEKLSAGHWFGRQDSVAEVSIDSGLVSSLGIALGDEMTWNVQGIDVRTRVTSFRAVDHTQLQPTFPVVFSPGALDRAPAQVVFLANAATPQAVALLQRDVARRFPAIASLDLTVVQQTVTSVLSRVTTAMRFIAFISLGLAIPVLFSAVAATRRERLREGVLFKTLGASRRQVGRLMLAEYGMLGALGSVAGLVLSFGSAWGLMHFIFKVPFVPAVVPALWVGIGMTLLAMAIGMLTSRETFATTPMAALREG